MYVCIITFLIWWWCHVTWCDCMMISVFNHTFNFITFVVLYDDMLLCMRSCHVMRSLSYSQWFHYIVWWYLSSIIHLILLHSLYCMMICCFAWGHVTWCDHYLIHSDFITLYDDVCLQSYIWFYFITFHFLFHINYGTTMICIWFDFITFYHILSFTLTLLHNSHKNNHEHPKNPSHITPQKINEQICKTRA